MPELPRSHLSFADVCGLKHVVIAYFIEEEPDVLLWNADIVKVNEPSATVDVRIREWTRLVHDVKPAAIFRPSSLLGAV